MENTLYRHGDVLLVPVQADDLEVIKEDDKVTLAYGEVTGHSHQLIAAMGAKVAMLKGFDEKRYAKIFDKPATLKHEEHKTLTILPGLYEIRIEREYDYFEESMRKVID